MSGIDNQITKVKKAYITPQLIVKGDIDSLTHACDNGWIKEWGSGDALFWGIGDSVTHYCS